MTHLTKNAFPEERQPNDPDAVADITALLAKHGHPNPSGWEASKDAQEAQGKAPKLQRFLINRHWRGRLGSLEVSTSAERFCLIDGEINHAEYLRVFEKNVVPTIVKHAL